MIFTIRNAWGGGSTPSSGISVSPHARALAAGAFVATGIVATIFGGLLATGAVPALAAEGGWLAAYLIVVAGIAQIALGAGQAWLAAACPGFERNAFEWGALNLGNLGVVTGSLLGSFWIVLSGSIAFVAALGLFARGVRPVRRRVWAWLYYGLLALLLALAGVGVRLAAAQFSV